MFKKTIAMMMVAIRILNTTIDIEAKENKIDWYRLQAIEIETEANQMQVIDTSELNYNQIVHRKGSILVERVIGKVKNNKKDGRILNVPKDEEQYNYISYKNVKGIKKGDVVVTYLLYNPENNIEDDIIARWDYKIAK